MSDKLILADGPGVVSNVVQDGDFWKITVIYDSGTTRIYTVTSSYVMGCDKVALGDTLGVLADTAAATGSGDTIQEIAVTGTTTKVLTITMVSGTQFTATWEDLNDAAAATDTYVSNAGYSGGILTLIRTGGLANITIDLANLPPLRYHFIVGAAGQPASGTASFTPLDGSGNPLFAGKNIKVYREGEYQFEKIDRGISYVKASGNITFYPDLYTDEDIIIEEDTPISTGNITGGGGSYTLPIASAGTLGGIKIGTGLTVDPATGVVTADAATSTYTDEQAQDAVGTILSTEFTYDDATPGISINTISQSKVTNLTSDISSLNTTINSKLTGNAAITGATKTKVTYDSKGLVTAGADATTADIADSLNKRYVTDAQQTVIGNTSGTNTGDETAATIKTKLGITTLSGSNTGDQDLSGLVVKNAAITGATKTKVTYDSKGLVTAGADATTTDIAEGTGLYFTNARAIAAPLTGYTIGSDTALAATDTILQALGKLEAKANAGASVTQPSGQIVYGTGSGITSSSSLAYNANPTASGANQTTIGLDIAPTFNNGAFGGVTNYALRVGGNQFINGGTLKVTRPTASTIPHLQFFEDDNANDYFGLTNLTTVAGQFVPAIQVKSDTSAYSGTGDVGNFWFEVFSNDLKTTSRKAAIRFDVRKYDNSGAVANRDIFEIGSYANTYMLMDAAGKLGLGTTNPTSTLHVVGSVFASTLNDSTGVAKMVTTTNGVLSYQAIPGGSSYANGTATTNSLFWNGSTYAPRNIVIGDLPDLSGTYVAKNAAITAGTNTKITYDAKGLVTAATAATTADIADSLNKRYVTDANLTVIGNTSGTNTGDETASTIKTKLGITTLSGSNTGDQDLSGLLPKNAAITGATKTKITYDANGLVTAGADATTDDITEGANLYLTNSRVIGAAITGYTIGSNTALAATDTILQALGKLEAKANAGGGGTTYAGGSATTQALFWNSTTYAPRNIVIGDLPDLSGTYAALAGAQTFTGDKTFSGMLYSDGANNLRYIAKALGSTVLAEGLATAATITGAGGLTSGQMRIIAVWLPYAATITGVKFFQVATGAYTASNYNGVGLYTYNGAGTLTLVASSTDDGTLWASAANTMKSKAFSSPYVATAGLYYIALLYSSSAQTAQPTIGIGTALNSAGTAGDFTNSAVLIGAKNSQTALPASTTMASLTSSGTNYYAGLY